MTTRNESVRASYDTVAGDYAERFQRELDHKPFDRFVLDRFADVMRGAGPVADIGCGPGQITRYLADRGVDIRGIDLSPEMISTARAANPGIRFDVGDMQRLDTPNGAWAGIAAFYSIIHIPREQVTATLREFRRTLGPGGALLLTHHLGGETVHVEEWFDSAVDVDFHFFERAEMEGYLRDAGFTLEQARERDPYPNVEADTRRAYTLAAAPSSARA